MRNTDQVQLSVRPTAPPGASETHCRAAVAHHTLRRFAHDYVFGVSTRLGARASTDATPSAADAFVSPSSRTDFAARAATDADAVAARTHVCVPDSDTPKASPLFGDAAPRVASSLHVKERPIGRKPTPKRCRDHVSVDALTAMFDSLLDKKKRLRPQQQQQQGKVVTGDGDEAVQEGKSNSVVELEDNDTADELSFLVNRCDIDEKQSGFMPYIT